jgi:hypothetical protein
LKGLSIVYTFGRLVKYAGKGNNSDVGKENIYRHGIGIKKEAVIRFSQIGYFTVCCIERALESYSSWAAL